MYCSCSSSGTNVLILLSAGTGGGIYFSTNSGVSWTYHPVSRAFNSTNLAYISPDGSIMAVNENKFAAQNANIYISIDSGTTWASLEVSGTSSVGLRDILINTLNQVFTFRNESNVSIYRYDAPPPSPPPPPPSPRCAFPAVRAPSDIGRFLFSTASPFPLP
jgi:hypothetical protein